MQVNGAPAKPSTPVRPGDEVRVRVGELLHIVIAARIIKKRVGALIAVGCYVDTTPPPPPREEVAMVPTRDRGAGRPTKRERREIDKLLRH